MRAYQVNLKQEVTHKDVYAIITWMNNAEVTRYLNETSNISEDIRAVAEKAHTYDMTPLFNRNGSFYIICVKENHPVGFLRLARRPDEAEMVIAIGDENNWGKGIGTQAISEGLSQAFFQWRIPRVIAKIDPRNVRSRKAFEKTGFQLERETPHNLLYSISMDSYIKSILAK